MKEYFGFCNPIIKTSLFRFVTDCCKSMFYQIGETVLYIYLHLISTITVSQNMLFILKPTIIAIVYYLFRASIKLINTLIAVSGNDHAIDHIFLYSGLE